MVLHKTKYFESFTNTSRNSENRHSTEKSDLPTFLVLTVSGDNGNNFSALFQIINIYITNDKIQEKHTLILYTNLEA